MPGDPEPQQERTQLAGPHGFLVSWKATAIVAIVIATTCLGSLAVVASVKSADLLSTIALALAISAFTVQIIIFFGQTAVTTQQVSQASTVYVDTKALLTRIETQAQAT